jgi:lipoprotein-anchoring transpeptidase ErfK/SrfK
MAFRQHRLTEKRSAGVWIGQVGFAAIIVAALLLPSVQPALAQTDAIVPIINPLLLTGARPVEEASAASIAHTLPALPALSPAVGPFIKRTYLDEMDRRTTAFLPALSPELLAALSPIEMPQTTAHWVRVDLSEQTAIAYSGATPIRGFVIASGLPNTPTVTGTFHIRAKVRSQLMEGGSPAEGNYYNLPNVQWVQYFHQDYGFHGTYWHYAFGSPRSHGCINMTNADAKWLWDFLSPAWDGSTIWQNVPKGEGALVIVHE